VTESSLGRKVFALTGLARGEGRTTLALTLARRLAAGGAKVLLVDADFEAPQLGAQIGLLIDQGWDIASADGAPLWDTMVESLTDRLTVMPLAQRSAASATGRTAMTGSAHVWTSTPTAPRWEDLRPHFDMILVDAGPVASSIGQASSLPLAVSSADAAIVAFDCRSGSQAQLTVVQRKLLDAGVFPLGVAETFCSEGA
jgi:polysaccharide biosynthesis transport protein